MTDHELKFRDYLKKKKLKFTPERQFILKLVFDLHNHFNIDQLYQRVKAKRKGISIATIYRTLPLLVKSGLIRETLRCQGRTSYEHVFGHKHHDHLLCIKCGRIVEFVEEKIERLQNRICEKHGFEPVEHKLGIRGYCRKCKRGSKKG